MTTAITITQYDIDEDLYKMRIGDEVIDLPKSLTDRIGSAIGTVEPFHRDHAHLVYCAWDGSLVEHG